MKKILPEELQQELHPILNEEIDKKRISGGSNRKLWWKCEEGHEWEDTPAHRYGGRRGCPYCSGKRVCKDNCLATINPKLAKQWNRERNKNLTANDVTAHSGKSVWWKCEKGHEWEAKIYSRQNGRGCPFCSGKKVGRDNCLAFINPELAKEWHQIKNKELTPNEVTVGSRKSVWWKCEKGHVWKACIKNRNKGDGCPYCANQRVCKDNCLAVMNPTLAKEWHPTKNGELTPYEVTASSHKSLVWWKCEKGHEWEATPNRRTDRGCPYCSGARVCIDNCLATICPELIEEWHPTKNGDITPYDITSASKRKVWWKCKKGHEWQAEVDNRKRGTKCPKCSNSTSYPDKFIYYCLSFIFGEENVFLRKKIKIENGVSEVDCYVKSIDLCIAYDGWFYHKEKHKQDYEKGQKIIEEGKKLVIIREKPLPQLEIRDSIEFFINQREKEKVFGELIIEIIEKIKIKYPEIILEKMSVEYLKQELDNDDIRLKIESQYAKVNKKENSIDKKLPLSKEWNYEKNRGLEPENFTYGSNIVVWWKCLICDFEWTASIKYRSNGGGVCPNCRKKYKGEGGIYDIMRSL